MTATRGCGPSGYHYRRLVVFGQKAFHYYALLSVKINLIQITVAGKPKGSIAKAQAKWRYFISVLYVLLEDHSYSWVVYVLSIAQTLGSQS